MVNAAGDNHLVPVVRALADDSALYGVYFNSADIVVLRKMNISTGATNTVATVSSINNGIVQGVSALDAANHRYFFAGKSISSGDLLVTVNTLTGVSWTTRASGLASLEYDASSGILYGVYSSASVAEIRSIDTSTGIIVTVATVPSIDSGVIQGVSAFDVVNHRYFFAGISSNKGSLLVAVDTLTGTSVTWSASTSELCSLEYDANSGVLYGVYAGNTGAAVLKKIDTSTGAAATVATILSINRGVFQGVSAFDSVSHRYFFAGKSLNEEKLYGEKLLVAVDTLTGTPTAWLIPEHIPNSMEYAAFESDLFKSLGSQDGWILESAETGNKGGSQNGAARTFNLGDAKGDKQYRAILSFDTATLPDAAVITNVTLKIKRLVAGFFVGNDDPFMWGNGLKADVCKDFFGAANSLELRDFNYNSTSKCVSPAGTFGDTPTIYWYTADISDTAFTKIKKDGLTQFRLRFAKDDNDDGSADYLKFYSGNAINQADIPQLIVEYYIP
jgi:hypothetical protein